MPFNAEVGFFLESVGIDSFLVPVSRGLSLKAHMWLRGRLQDRGQCFHNLQWSSQTLETSKT